MITGRRSRVDLYTHAELAIRNAALAVENTGCDPLLTDAVNSLSKAMSSVQDYVLSNPSGSAKSGGEYTLICPTGRIFRADTPLQLAKQEQEDRVPASVRWANLKEAIEEERLKDSCLLEAAKAAVAELEVFEREMRGVAPEAISRSLPLLRAALIAIDAYDGDARVDPRTPDNSKVICPNCVHEFHAISVDDQAHRSALCNHIAQAWGIIANVGGGNWRTQSEDWQKAATVWEQARDPHEGITPRQIANAHQLASAHASGCFCQECVERDRRDLGVKSKNPIPPSPQPPCIWALGCQRPALCKDRGHCMGNS